MGPRDERVTAGRRAGSREASGARTVTDSKYTPFLGAAPRAPLFERTSTLFRVRGVSKRPLRCALYRVDSGYEPRLEYEDRVDLMHSQLFRAPDLDAIATLADKWHRALMAKGCEELPVDERE